MIKISRNQQLNQAQREQNNNQNPESLISFQFIKSTGKKGKDDGYFDYPWSVAFNQFNKIIAVADSKNHRVQLFNKNFQLLGKFTAQGGQVPSSNAYVSSHTNHREPLYTTA